MKFKFGDEVTVKAGFFKGVEGEVIYIYGESGNFSYIVDGHKHINNKLLDIKAEIKEYNLELIKKQDNRCSGNCCTCTLKKDFFKFKIDDLVLIKANEHEGKTGKICGRYGLMTKEKVYHIRLINSNIGLNEFIYEEDLELIK